MDKEFAEAFKEEIELDEMPNRANMEKVNSLLKKYSGKFKWRDEVLYVDKGIEKYVTSLIKKGGLTATVRVSSNPMREEVELDEKGTAYPATVDTLRKIVKDKQHQTVMFKSGQAIVDLFTASAMVQVYDALKKPDMKKTFEKMITDKAGFMKTQAFAMKMIGK